MSSKVSTWKLEVGQAIKIFFKGLCISKRDSELSSSDFTNTTNISNMQPEGVKITNDSYLTSNILNSITRKSFRCNTLIWFILWSLIDLGCVQKQL